QAENAKGPSRLVPRLVTVDSLAVDQQVLGVDTFYDQERKETCIPTLTFDNALRCLPVPADDASSVARVLAYSDGGCTKPVAVGQTGCNKAVYAFFVDQGCIKTKARVYPVTGTYNGKVYVKDGSNCAKTPLPFGYSVYTLGKEIPASSFQKFDES